MNIPLVTIQLEASNFNESSLQKKRNFDPRRWFAEYNDAKEFHKKIEATKGAGSEDAQSLGRALILGLSQCRLKEGSILMIPPKERLRGGSRKDIIKFLTLVKLKKGMLQRILIPWENNFKVGCGIDSEGNPKAGMVDVHQLTYSVVPNMEEAKADLYLVSSEEHKEYHLSKMLSAGLSGTFLSVSGSFNMAKNLKVEENSASLVIQHSFVNQDHIEVKNFGDISFLRTKIEENLDDFIKVYGTHCIVGYVSGGNFYGQLTYTSESHETSKKVALKAKASLEFGPLKFTLGNGEDNQYNKDQSQTLHNVQITGKLQSSFFKSIIAINSVIDLSSNYREYLKKLESFGKTISDVNQPTGPLAAVCVPWIEIFKCSESLYKEYVKHSSAMEIQNMYSKFVQAALEKGRYWNAAHVCITAETTDVNYYEIIKKVFAENRGDGKKLSLAVGNLLRFCSGLQILKEKQGSLVVKSLLLLIRDSIKKKENINLVEFLGDVILDSTELMKNPQNYDNLRKILSLLQDQEIEACQNYVLHRLTNETLKKQIPYLFKNEKTFDSLQDRLKGYLENNQIKFIADLLLEEEKTLGHALLLKQVLEKYTGNELFSLCHLIRKSNQGTGVSYLRKHLREQISHPVVADMFLNPKNPFFIVDKTNNNTLFKRPYLWLIRWMNRQQTFKICLNPFQKSEIHRQLTQNQKRKIRQWTMECIQKNGKPRFNFYNKKGVKKFVGNIVLAAGNYASL